MVAAAEGLAEIAPGTSYGTPALKVRKKLLCRVKDAETVVVMCPLEEKELLIKAAPEFYFETDHYRGWPAILVRGTQCRPTNFAYGSSVLGKCTRRSRCRRRRGRKPARTHAAAL